MPKMKKYLLQILAKTFVLLIIVNLLSGADLYSFSQLISIENLPAKMNYLMEKGSPYFRHLWPKF